MDHHLTFINSYDIDWHKWRQRRTEHKGISMLLLVKTQLALSKDIQNHDADFLHLLLRNKDNKLAHTCNSSFRYKDDVLSRHRAILESVIHYIASIQISLNSKILLQLKSLLLTLSFSLPTTTEEDKKQTSTTNTMTSLF